MDPRSLGKFRMQVTIEVVSSHSKLLLASRPEAISTQ